MALILLFTSNLAWGQVQPAARGGAENGIYALFSSSRPNYGNDWLFGGTWGGYLQWHKFIGLDGRVIVTRWGPSPNHQYLGVIGPRVAFGRGRWAVYASGEGGIGHARYPGGDGYGGSWLLTTGVDYHMRPRIKLRLGEFGYGGISVLDHGLNPKILSAGIVIKVF
jgi:hypothetical protein